MIKIKIASFGENVEKAQDIFLRLRTIKKNTSSLSEEDQDKAMLCAILIERNIAAYAAEQYAMMNQEEIFTPLSEIMEVLDNIIDERTNE